MFKKNKTGTRITLDSQNSQYLQQIAKKLGISEGEVILRGLELMEFYAENKSKSDELIKKNSLSNKKIDPLAEILMTLDIALQ